MPARNQIRLVVDYVWGTNARTIIATLARAGEDAHPVRFVQVGEASREPVDLPGAALRSSAIQIMGSGLKSVPFPKLLEAIRKTFELAEQGKLHLPTRVVSLSTVEEHWEAQGMPRVVFSALRVDWSDSRENARSMQSVER